MTFVRHFLFKHTIYVLISSCVCQQCLPLHRTGACPKALGLSLKANTQGFLCRANRICCSRWGCGECSGSTFRLSWEVCCARLWMPTVAGRYREGTLHFTFKGKLDPSFRCFSKSTRSMEMAHIHLSLPQTEVRSGFPCALPLLCPIRKPVSAWCTGW